MSGSHDTFDLDFPTCYASSQEELQNTLKEIRSCSKSIIRITSHDLRDSKREQEPPDLVKLHTQSTRTPLLVRAIIDRLNSLPALQMIFLTDFIPIKDLLSLGQAITTSPLFCEFAFLLVCEEFASLDEQEAACFLEFIEKNRAITTLWLIGDGVPLDDKITLSKKTSDLIDALAKNLERPHSSIRRLNIKEHFAEKDHSRLSQAIEKNKTVTALDRTPSCSIASPQQFSGLLTNTSITEMHLCNKRSPEDNLFFDTLLKQNQTLLRLKIEFRPQLSLKYHGSYLTTGLLDDGSSFLAGLAANKTLTELKFEESYSRNLNHAKLMSAVSQHPSLQALSGITLPTGLPSAATFAQVMSNHAALTVLDVSYPGGIDSARLLADIIKKNQSLVKCVLRYNASIDQEYFSSSATLLNALKFNKTLARLYFYERAFSTATLYKYAPVIQLLKTNRNICCFFSDQSKSSWFGDKKNVASIRAELAKNQYLNLLWMSISLFLKAHRFDPYPNSILPLIPSILALCNDDSVSYYFPDMIKEFTKNNIPRLAAASKESLPSSSSSSSSSSSTAAKTEAKTTPPSQSLSVFLNRFSTTLFFKVHTSTPKSKQAGECKVVSRKRKKE